MSVISGISSTYTYTSSGCSSASCEGTALRGRSGNGTSDAEDDLNSERISELSDGEKREVEKLRIRDQEVRAHENAHSAAGGQLVRGGAHYEYQTGPDGKRYAVGGEVSIDTSVDADNPEKTIRKMQIVKKAALAPAQPSAQDRSVAAKASQQEAQARQQVLQEDTMQQPNGSHAPAPVEGYSAEGKERRVSPACGSMVSVYA